MIAIPREGGNMAMNWLKNLYDKHVNNPDARTAAENLQLERNNLNTDVKNELHINSGVQMLLRSGLTGAEGNKSKSQLTEIPSDPLKALETNEKLRNAIAAKGKEMGWDLFPTNNVPTTDLGLIRLNEKIRIHQSDDTTDTVNILMFGKSGCGQTTLLSYLTGNKHLIGTDSMSTQQFFAETFQLPSDTGMTNIRINVFRRERRTVEENCSRVYNNR